MDSLLFFYRILFTITILMTLFSCKKNEVVHENKIIKDNDPPLDTSVSVLTVQSYVNKLYIDLIGREPDSLELNDDVDYLVDNNLSNIAKGTIVEDIISTNEYHKRLFEVLSTEMIGGVDSADIAEQITLFNMVKQASTDSIEKLLLTLEIERFEEILSAQNDFRAGNIDVNDYYKRFIDNAIYDDINMGSENFVLASFEDLYNRFPTTSELEEGIRMVENESTALFLIDGSNKGDYINIITSYLEFYEGIINDNYLIFLQREPTATEVSDMLTDFVQSKDLQELQKEILIKKEYAGF